MEELEIEHQVDVLENEWEGSDSEVLERLVPGEELHQRDEIGEQLWSFAHSQRRQVKTLQDVLIFWTNKHLIDK